LVFKLSKGLDLPIRGVPDQRIGEGKALTKVAVLGLLHRQLQVLLLKSTVAISAH